MSVESRFDIKEIFFSRTDLNGLILAGNSVFQRVSEFSWTSLLNSPHNIIRHPDMPKGVFNLLWETIQNGNSVGAYVKNQSQGGKHYWVFALVMPIENCYLSVRIKPTSDLFLLVQDEYKKLKVKELTEKITPAQSHAALLKGLSELGFK